MLVVSRFIIALVRLFFRTDGCYYLGNKKNGIKDKIPNCFHNSVGGLSYERQ